MNAWVVEQTIKFTYVLALGTQSLNATSKLYYDPAHGLDVFRHSESQTEQGTTVRDGRIVAESRCTLTLCCDHRAVDDVVAAKLMSVCASILERPMLLIV